VIRNLYVAVVMERSRHVGGFGVEIDLRLVFDSHSSELYLYCPSGSAPYSRSAESTSIRPPLCEVGSMSDMGIYHQLRS